MKRHAVYGTLVALAALLALGGCDAPDAVSRQTGNRVDTGWTRPPQVVAVQLRGSDVKINGSAAPGARVLLRGDEGEAYAVGADGSGQFELTLTLPDEKVILTPEVQQGQDTVKGPQRLLILTTPGLAVMQTDSGGSQRLTPGPRLDSVDGDGKALVASGRATPNQSVMITVPGRFEARVVAGDNGRWSTNLSTLSDQPVTLNIEDHSFTYPGPGGPLEEGEQIRVSPVDNGWRLTRRVGGRSVLTSWFPNP